MTSSAGCETSDRLRPQSCIGWQDELGPGPPIDQAGPPAEVMASPGRLARA